TVKETGKTGSLWRIPYSFQLPEFCCDHFVLSPTEGVGTGDSFSQFPIARGEHLIGDRGYSYVRGVEHIAAHQGYVLVRLNPLSLPLFTPKGQRLPLLRRVATVRAAGRIGEGAPGGPGPKQALSRPLSALRARGQATHTARET